MPTKARTNPYRLDLISNLTQLSELQKIDIEAYDDAAFEMDVFSQWWKRYDLGVKAVWNDSSIVAAIGLWALGEEQTRRFIGGQIREADLRPVVATELETAPVQFWYCSGIVSTQRKTLDSPLRKLLRCGIGAWTASGHIKYPMWLYALGYSDDGISMLERFGFEVVQPAAEMPDHCPLYGRRFYSAAEVRKVVYGK